ncbi:Lrp/AsnC family transcriptional regulator, partial [Streptomyces sp. t39]
AVGRTLAERPEVMTLVSITGDYQVCAHVALHDPYHLQEFLTGVVGALDGVGEIDVTILLQVFKRGGFAAVGARAAGPDGTRPRNGGAREAGHAPTAARPTAAEGTAKPPRLKTCSRMVTSISPTPSSAPTTPVRNSCRW